MALNDEAYCLAIIRQANLQDAAESTNPHRRLRHLHLAGVAQCSARAIGAVA